MASPRKKLGKGLSAIVKPRSVDHGSAADSAESRDDTSVATAAHSPRPRHHHDAIASAGAHPAGGVRQIPTEAIVANPLQPRRRFDEAKLQELADSINANGVIQPIVVRPLKADDQSTALFELIAGERRWRAAQLAELKAVPAIIRECDDAHALELALVENLQREDLGPLERARAYREYLDTFGAKPEDLALRLGESRANVANYLRILNLQGEVQSMLESGALGMGHARAIAGVNDPQRQLAIARLAVRRNLSVRQVETLARENGPVDSQSAGNGPGTAPVRPAYLDELEREMSRALGVRVQLRAGKKKNAGTIMIKYDSLEQFEQIAGKLGASHLLE